MRADAHDLKDGSDHECQKCRIAHELADRDFSLQHLARTDQHDQSPHNPAQRGRGKAHHGHRGQRAKNVFEQALDATRKYLVFARLRVISLYDAHAGERFRKPPADLGVDFRTLAKDWAQHAERFPKSNHAHQKQRERQAGHHRTNAQQHDQRNYRRQQASQKFHEARAY